MKLKIFLFICLLLNFAFLFGQTSSPGDTAFALLRKKEYSKALDVYRKILKEQPGNADAISKAVYLLAETADLQSDKQIKTVFLTEAKPLATQCASMPETGAWGKLALATYKMQESQVKLSREKAELLKAAWPLLLEAINLDSDMPEAWYQLGKWQLTVMGLPAMDQGVMRSVNGGIFPPEAGYDKGIMAFKNARARDSIKNEAIFYEGVSYHQLGNDSLALVYWQALSKMPADTEGPAYIYHKCMKEIESAIVLPERKKTK